MYPQRNVRRSTNYSCNTYAMSQSDWLTYDYAYFICTQIGFRPNAKNQSTSVANSFTPTFLFKAIFYRRWSKDMFTQGAYSDRVVGTTSQDYRNIGETLGRLYFAGEATSEDWNGYMQGAYLSGKEKGRMIADDLMRTRIEHVNQGHLLGETLVHEEL